MGSRKPVRQNTIPQEAAPSGSIRRFPIVCIGASAGGLEAFSRLLEALPRTTGMAFVVIQHLDPSHPSALPPLLAKKSTLPVVEANDGLRVQPDHVYVIPPDTVLSISRGALRLAMRASEKRFMPVDHFMRSLAEELKGGAIGVILSGTGADGTLGMEAIKSEGGITFAQDEKTAQYTGMPASAINSGCVDFVLPPAEIARELVRVTRHPVLTERGDNGEEEFGVSGNADQFNTVFDLLRKGTGLDFSSYKRTTIRRRIARRMTLHRYTAIDDYIALLQRNRREVEELSQDLLIKVTTFFRDAEAFDTLKTKVFPTLLKQKRAADPIRVWVPGCSTGEEVYSIGMSLIETIGDAAPGLQCQIFATDISESAIDKGRNGFYTESIKEDVGPERLRRFFIRTAEGYRIAKAVRDMCIFARQDLTKDPPFSKLDLISCRNVLIYMGTDLQKRILPIFHYALKPNGYLMLGSAESPGSFSTLFAVVDKKGKIYAKKSSGESRPGYLPPAASPVRKAVSKKSAKDEIPATAPDLFKEADKIVLSRYAPAGVLLNDDLEILQFRGHTGPYLEHAPGKPTVSILKLVRDGLVYELKATADRALKEGVAVRSDPVPVKQDGTLREVVMDVVPIDSALSNRPFLLVLFSEVAATTAKKGKGSVQLTKRSEARLVTQLRRELNAVREELQSVIEEQEAAQEEFKSANEEILSSNEELQSTNEELETAKEELQSANEELTTLNEELLTRNAELGQLNGDITNLLSSINVPILMLSHDLKIRRFTPVAGALLNLIPGDVGRPISDINPNIDLPDMRRMVTEVIDTMAVKEKDVRARDGRWYSLRIRPYRTLDNKIDGATVLFIDIDAIRKSQQGEAVVETMRHPLIVLDSRLRMKSANPAFYRQFETNESETLGKTIFELGDGQWDIPTLRTLLEDILPKRTTVEDFRVEHTFKKLGRRTMMMNARRLYADHGDDQLILVAFEDVTDKRRA